MPNSFRLRPATSADAKACARAHHAAWQETYTQLLPASHWDTDTVERRTARWKRLLEANSPVTVTVAGVEGDITGFAVAGPSRPRGDHAPLRPLELQSLYVLAEHHGSGIGQALLEAVLPEGAPAELWMADPNPRAQRFYERNGFRTDGARFIDETLGLAEARLVR